MLTHPFRRTNQPFVTDAIWDRCVSCGQPERGHGQRLIDGTQPSAFDPGPAPSADDLIAAQDTLEEYDGREEDIPAVCAFCDRPSTHVLPEDGGPWDGDPVCDTCDPQDGSADA